MLLPLLTFTAILIGWIAAVVSVWGSDYQKTSKSSVLTNKRVTLWSLILFLFFPTKHFAGTSIRYVSSPRMHL